MGKERSKTTTYSPMRERGCQIMDGGNPSLRRNRIHHGMSAGVHVYNRGHGTLEDNDIFANAGAAIEVKGESNPTLRRNRIHDGKASGLFFHTKGQGTCEDNEIFANSSLRGEKKKGGGGGGGGGG